MAKLIGPLHSLDATGALGKAITFTGSTGGARAIVYKKPSGTGTPVRKALYSAGCTAWKALTSDEKQIWVVVGTKTNITGFNAFMSNWLTAPPLPPGTTWDGGTTTWDSGTTTWD